MNPATASTLAARGGRGASTALGTVLLGYAACGSVAQAQNVLTPPPRVDVTPPALQEFRASETGEPAPEGGWMPTGLSLWQPPWQIGPLIARPHFAASYSYVDGILQSPGEPATTTTFQFAPGVLFLLGSHWTLDYTPSFVWFSNNSFDNQVNQNLSLNGWGAYEDWVLSLALNLSTMSGPQVATATQTQETTYSTTFGAAYLLNSKVSFDLSLSQNYESAQEYQSYWQYSTMDYVNYQFWPRFQAGVGLGGGYVDVSSGSDMTFEQVQGRISWRASDKTSVTLHGGLEYRQFLTGGVSPLTSPVFGLDIQTRLSNKTTLSLGASQTTSASYFENQVNETSTVGLTLSQALAKKLSMSLGGGYSHVTYTATASDVSANSAYDYTSITLQLTYAIIKRGSISASYQFNDNVSNQPGLSFTSNQIGIQFAYSF